MSFQLLVHYRVERLKRQFRLYLGWKGGLMLVLLLAGASLSLFTPQWEGMMEMPVAPRLKEPEQAIPLVMATGPILAQDNFQDLNPTFWEQVKHTQILSSDPQGSVSFIDGSNSGLIIHGSGEISVLLGPQVDNAEAVCIGSLSSYDGANVGMFLRRVDAKNWYKTYLDGTDLVLQESRAGVTKVLARVPFKVNSNQLYILRFHAIGNQLEARAWAQGTPEPTSWMVKSQVTTGGKGTQEGMSAGYAGISLRLQMNVTARITRFIEVSQD